MQKLVDRLFLAFRQNQSPGIIADIYDATSPELWKLASLMARSHAAIEDLVQATYLRAIQRKEHWNPEQPLADWLAELMLECHLDTFKESFVRYPEDGRNLLAGPSSDPAQALQAAEFQARLEAVLQRLGEPYQQVLTLSLLEGRSSGEIGELLGRSDGTVRSQLKRGLERLRQCLPGLWIAPLGKARPNGAPLEPSEQVRTAVLNASTVAPSGLAFLWPALILLPLIGGFGMWSWSDQSSRAEARTAVQPERSVLNPIAVDARPTTGQSIGEPSSAARQAISGGVPTQSSKAQAMSTVLGRVVGADGFPIAGIAVALFSEEPWSPEFTPAHKSSLAQWLTHSDADGRYRFEVPTPSGCTPIVDVGLNEPLIGVRYWLGSVGNDLWPLGPGEYTLPLTKLMPAEVLRVQVLDANLQPLPNAVIRLWPGDMYPEGTTQETDDAGNTRFAKVLSGRQEITLSQGAFAAKMPPVWLEGNGAQEVLRLVAPDAQEILVHVANVQSAPVAGARLLATYPELGGLRLFAPSVTDIGGNTRLKLPVGETVYLQARVPGLYGSPVEIAVTPSSGPIHLSMAESAPRKVHIIVQGLAEPPRHATLQIRGSLPGSPVEAVHTISSAPDADGCWTIPTFPGHRLIVQVAGFQFVDATLDAGTEPIEVKLVANISLLGRVTKDGKPVAGARIELLYGESLEGPEPTLAQAFAPKPPSDTCFSKRLESDSEGRFALPHILQPQNQAAISLLHPEHGSCRRFIDLSQTREGVLDLGDCPLEPSATITGRIVLPAGFESHGTGFVIALDSPLSAIRTTVQADLSFKLELLPAGPHTLRVADTLTIAGSAFAFPVTLFAGETRDVVLDLRGWTKCWPRLLLLDEDQRPLPDVEVALVPSDFPSQAPEPEQILGFTDAHGQVSGCCQFAPNLRPWIRPRGELLWQLPDPSGTIAADSTKLQTVTLANNPHR